MQLKTMAMTRQKKKPVSLKFDPDDWQVVLAKAARFTGGNASAWIRYASTMLDPKTEDLVDENEANNTDNVPGTLNPVASIR
jgi:hypothetical protein